MTEYQILTREINSLKKMIAKIVEPKVEMLQYEEPFLWENEVAEKCRCKVSTIRTYKAKKKFKKGVDYIKTGRRTQYKESSVLRVLREKK